MNMCPDRRCEYVEFCLLRGVGCVDTSKVVKSCILKEGLYENCKN